MFRLGDGSWRAACPGGSPSFRGATRTEAMRRRELYLSKHRSILSLPKRARGTFAAAVAGWLSAARSSLRPRTIESYEETARKYILPAIGAVAIGKLTAEDVQRAMASAKSPRTQNYVRSVCHMALEHAVDGEVIARNVARKVPRVASSRVELEMPSLEQWTALLAAIAAEAAGTRAILLVLAFCGLREGEACGLRWVDYDGAQLRVARSADRAGELAQVKTAAGRRIVPVPEIVAAALAEWHEAQAAQREKWTARWKAAAVPDLIFSTRYGSPWSPRNVLRAVHRVTERAGARHSAHYLRHLAISHLIAEGVDIKTVQLIAGHSSIRVTLDVYGHLMPGQLEKATAAMNRRGGKG